MAEDKKAEEKKMAWGEKRTIQEHESTLPRKCDRNAYLEQKVNEFLLTAHHSAVLKKKLFSDECL